MQYLLQCETKFVFLKKSMSSKEILAYNFIFHLESPFFWATIVVCARWTMYKHWGFSLFRIPYLALLIDLQHRSFSNSGKTLVYIRENIVL